MSEPREISQSKAATAAALPLLLPPGTCPGAAGFSQFPNAEVSSSFFDGVNNAYIATLPEYLLGIGGVGLAISLVIVGMKVFRLLPASLADKVIDPHH